MEQIDYNKIKELEKNYGTPFYVMNGERFRNNIRSFREAFTGRYDKVIVGYSLKTNYVPALAKIASEEGCYAEVVSGMEYQLAERIGFRQIIFNGPVKRPWIFQRALEQKAIINLDSDYEVDCVCQYKQSHPEENINVGIRININITDSCGNSVIQCGLRFGRFGFPDDTVGANIERLRKAGVRINSIHGHTSTSDRAVVNYNVIATMMLNTCQQYQLDDIEYFNVGGGFFGAAPEGMDLTGKPTYKDYADVILNTVLANSWFRKQSPYIVLEPGSSVVANVFSYHTKVYQIKTVGRVNFVVVDGTVMDIKPTMHTRNLPHKTHAATVLKKRITCDVVGSTCMEKDVMLKDVPLPQLQVGDYIEFLGVGAYTICMTPSFINYQAPILAVENGEYTEIRRQQTIDDILTTYKF